MTIAITTGRVSPVARDGARRGGRRSRLKRVLLITGSIVAALILVAVAWIGLSLYRIDHAVHHVGLPAALLAKGENDLLAIVQGPDHSEQIFVFHQTDGHTNVLQIPKSLTLPLRGGGSTPINALDVHAPAAIIAGLNTIGIPVAHYVGVDLHAVSPSSNLGRLATGKLSVTSMISNPTGTTSLLEQVASHVYLGPGTPVSAVLSLMNVATTKTTSVPTAKDGHGQVVPAPTFASVMRGFL